MKNIIKSIAGMVEEVVDENEVEFLKRILLVNRKVHHHEYLELSSDGWICIDDEGDNLRVRSLEDMVNFAIEMAKDGGDGGESARDAARLARVFKRLADKLENINEQKV